MSTFTKLTWPTQDLTAVCISQAVTFPAYFLLNGTLADSSIPNQVSLIKAKMIRSVSIHSATVNYTGTSFIIQGLQNGAYVSETIAAGPGIGLTVYGTQYYDIITSVKPSTSVTGVSIGTGDAGFLPLIVVNTTATIINYSATVLIPSSNSGTTTYSLFQTLDEVNNNFVPFVNQTTKFFPALGFVNGTTKDIGNSSAITNFVLFQIVSSTAPATDTLDFIFLQE